MAASSVLSDQAIAILKRRFDELKAVDPEGDFVFPGCGRSGHLADPKRAYNRIKKRMGITDLWIHDLRRTLASYMAIGNTSLPIIAKALNHKSQASTQIYARLMLDPVRSAVDGATKDMLQYMRL